MSAWSFRFTRDIRMPPHPLLRDPETTVARRDRLELALRVAVPAWARAVASCTAVVMLTGCGLAWDADESPANGAPPALAEVAAEGAAPISAVTEASVTVTPVVVATRPSDPTPTAGAPAATTVTPVRVGSPAPTVTTVQVGPSSPSAAGPPRTPTEQMPSVVSNGANSVDTIVNDMRLMNDMALAGAPPGPGWATGPGFVLMGNRPRGSATASWWQPYNVSFKSDAWWNVLIPWLVIFDGVGNAASNTRVEMRNLKAYYKSRSTGRWILITQGPVDGANYPKSLAGTDTQPAAIRTEAGGTVSVRPAGGNNAFHGWCCGAQPINPPDVAAVFVTMQVRLSLDNPALPDDRARARYLVKVGADYYPTARTRIEEFAPTGYNPGVGMSRFKLISSQWQSISFATLDVAVQDPPGGAITEGEFRSAPPPLE
jgi:hypothetical protein